MTEKKRTLVTQVFDDKYYNIKRDSLQWIVTEKKNGEEQYFTSIKSMLLSIANDKMEDKIVRNGMLKTINMLAEVKHSILEQISIILDSIEKDNHDKT